MLGYRLVARHPAGGKSGQHREGQLLTTTKSNLRESATETILPVFTGKGEKSEVRAHSYLW